MNQEKGERLIDESLMTVEELVDVLLEPVGEIIDEQEGVSMSLEKIELDMPIQLEVVSMNGVVQIGTSPPLYKIDTSFNPVFHQLRFSLEKI